MVNFMLHIVVQLLSCFQLLAAPWIAAHQASLSFTISQSLLTLMSIESVMPSSHLILCRPLRLLPSIYLVSGSFLSFFFFIYFYQLVANYFTTFQWVLSYIDMNQPWIYMYSPSRSPPPTSLSTRFLLVFPVHQARALVSCIPPGLVICFTIDNIHAALSKHPTLAFSHRVQKSVLYIFVSFSVLHIGLSLPSF